MSARRLGAVPIVLVIVVMLVGIVGLAVSAPAPRASPPVDIALDVPPPATPPPAATPRGRYPISGEATVVGDCVSGIDPNTVPAVIAQAFCVCTLNQYEQLYPTYDEFQRAAVAGAISDQIKTDISTAARGRSSAGEPCKAHGSFRGAGVAPMRGRGQQDGDPNRAVIH